MPNDERLYVFAREDLHRLLLQTIDSYCEWINEHGQDGTRAAVSACREVLGGLDAEDELHRHGECATTHVITPAGSLTALARLESALARAREAVSLG